MAPLASDRLPLLLLTFATLRWLQAGEHAAPLLLETGVPALAGTGPTTPVRGDGLHVAEGEPAVLLAERTGVYRIGPPEAERIVLANLFDDRESDIGRGGGGEWPASGRLPVPASAAGAREVGWWLYAAAAALLAVEWLVWLGRRA